MRAFTISAQGFTGYVMSGAVLRAIVACGCVWVGSIASVSAQGTVDAVRGIDAHAPTSSAAKDWAAMPYAYVVIDQDVRDVLSEFGKNVGLSVVLSPQVKGRLRGGIRAANAGEFLAQVTRSHALSWYVAEGILHVDDGNEIASRELSARHMDRGAIDRFVATIDMVGPRVAVRAGGEGTVIASGPPPYIAAVAQRLAAFIPPVAARAAREVRVFRGARAPETKTYPL